MMVADVEVESTRPLQPSVFLPTIVFTTSVILFVGWTISSS